MTVIAECYVGYYTGVGPSTDGAWCQNFSLNKDGSQVSNDNPYTDTYGQSWGYAESWGGTATAPGTWTFTAYSNGSQVESLTITILPNTHQLTTSAGTGGSISPSSGQYSGYQTISGSANTGYSLVRIDVSQNGSQIYSGLGPYSVNMDNGDASATAYFQKNNTTVNFSVGGTSKTYDGSPLSVSITPDNSTAFYSISFSDGTTRSGLSGGTTVSGPTNANTGSWSISVTGPDSSYLTGSGSSGSWSISRKSVTWSFGNLSNVYNGGSFTATATPSDGGAASGASYSLSYGPNSGGYTVSASANGNYTGSGSASAQISRKSVSFSFGNLSNQENGSTFDATVSPSDGSATYTSSTSYGPSQGSYTVSANATGNYTGSGSATATVTAPPPTPVSFSFSNTSQTYTGGALSASVSPSPSGATYTASLSGGPNVGSYAISADGTGTYSGHGSDTLFITKATPNVSWATPAAITYGTALSTTQLNATASVPGTFSYSPASGSKLNAGTQTLNVTFTPTDSANYNSVSRSVMLTVNKATLTVAADYETMVYGSAVPALTYTITGFVNNDTSAVVTGTPTLSTTATSSSNVGSYPISIPQGTLAASNYGFSMQPGALSVTAKSETFSISGTSATYDGAAKPITVTPSPDTGATYSVTYTGTSGTTYSTSSTAPTIAGTYSVAVNGTGNYTGSGSATLTIAKATPSIVWATPAAITYGTALSSTQLNAVAKGVGGATLTGTFTYTLPSGTIPNAGAQILSVSFVPTDTTNYNNGSGSVTLTVTKAALTVTANTASRVYQTANPAFTVAYSGFVNGDTAASLTTQPTATTTATISSPVVAGGYAIVPAGGVSSNYAFNYVNGTLTITKATPVITWATPAAITYGTALSSTSQLNATANTGGIFSYSPTSGAVLGAGNQTISVTFTPTDTTNYNSPVSSSVALVVNKATVTVTTTDKTMVYGSTVPALTYTITGFVNGDTSAVVTGSPSLTTTATSSSNVGTYPINAVLGTFAASNYGFSFVPGTMTVTAKPETVTIGGNLTPTYDGTARSVTVTSSPDTGATYTITYTGTGGTTYTASSTPPTNAGTYTVAVTGSGNYSGTASATLTIGKATPTITWATPAPITYGTALSNTQLNASGSVLGTISYSPTSGAVLGAGTPTLTATLTPTDGTNYATATKSVSLTVNKAALTAAADNKSKTYGSANPTLTISYSGFVNGDTVTSITPPTASTTATTSSPIGGYPINLTGGSAANYTFNLVNGTLTVNKATLAVTANNQSKVYGSAIPTLTYTITGYVNGDTSAVVTGAAAMSTTATSSSNVGTYPITPAQGTLAATNYSFSFVAGTLIITKATPNVTWAMPAPITYGTALGPTQLNASSSISGTFNYSPTSGAVLNAGPQTLSVTFVPTDSTNYSNGSGSVTLTVNQAPLTVTANNTTKVYGTANPSFSATYTGFVNGDTSAVVSGSPTFSTTATSSSPVGSYPITPTAGTLAAANYAFSTFSPGSLSVTKAPLTATADNLTKTYGSANPAFTISYSGFVNGDTVSAITAPTASTTATTSSGVGSYAISLSGGSAANYTIGLVNATLTVTKVSLTVAANIQTKVYGGANPVLTYAVSGFVNGDTASVISGAATVTTAATNLSSVGTYIITPAAGTLAATNYSFGPFVNGTLTVTPASLTVTANNQTKVYGAANPTLTYNVSGFVNGDTSSVVGGAAAMTTTATSASGVGSYTITPALGTLSATNYSFGPFVTGTLSVTKAPLIATANNLTKAYGSANPTLTITYSGFLNGDSVSAITAPSASTTATTSSSVGSYPITLTGGSAANYTLTLVNGTFTVNKATLTVAANNQSMVYGAVVPSLTYTITGYVNGDTSSVVAGSATVSTAASSTSGVGTYPITPAAGTLAASNYVFAFANGTLSVTPASLTVTANAQSKTYGSANPTLTYVLSGYSNGDTSAAVSGAASVSTTAIASSGVGTYTITPSVGTLSSANYTFGPFVNGTLTINKATLAVTANNASRTYGSANPSFTASYAGFVNGDTPAVVSGASAFSTAATASSGVATYPIIATVGTLSAANYAFGSFANGVLSVTPAPLTVKADDQSRYFGAANSALTYSFVGLVNGDTAASINGSPVISTAASTSSSAGTYSITTALGTLSSTNYTISAANGALVVLPKSITFTFGNLSTGYDGMTKTATVTPSDPAATYSASLNVGPGAGSYPVSATANGNYSGSGSDTATVTRAPVVFVFANLAQTYDGTVKSAQVQCSDANATFTTDLSKGPDAGTYVVTATATGNYTGSGSDHLVISPAQQTITLAPLTTTVFAGQPTTFAATGGANGYAWGGNTGAVGTSGNVTLTFANVGNYTLTVSNNASVNYQQSNTATATIDVVSNHQVNSLSPVASSYTIKDATSPMNGQTYGRLWNDGGWTAYLGRSGVQFEIKAQAWPAVKSIELQAKPPGGTWSQLSLQTPSTAATSADATLSVMLDSTAPGMPLVPLSYQQGNPLVGAWTFRARVQDSNDQWSDFSSEVTVQAILPVTTKTVSGQTVPPAGPLGDWFTASPVQNFPIQLWIP